MPDALGPHRLAALGPTAAWGSLRARPPDRPPPVAGGRFPRAAGAPDSRARGPRPPPRRHSARGLTSGSKTPPARSALLPGRGRPDPLPPPHRPEMLQTGWPPAAVPQYAGWRFPDSDYLLVRPLPWLPRDPHTRPMPRELFACGSWHKNGSHARGP